MPNEADFEAAATTLTGLIDEFSIVPGSVRSVRDWTGMEGGSKTQIVDAGLDASFVNALNVETQMDSALVWLREQAEACRLYSQAMGTYDSRVSQWYRAKRAWDSPDNVRVLGRLVHPHPGSLPTRPTPPNWWIER